ncbi:hypothetical protein J1N35_046046 [Gossypium stocksii]|uniref:Uncharacterized protein n=1 Tax=Gossypium stocksii TaxID=47602 RepID=A0A9D3U599_9ROSI|nr:hypothetical protein J1N35_046046 [Gossypium stocksii]
MVVFESVASPFGLSTKLAATAAEYLLTLEFELVPALTIKDSVASPFASQVFCDVLSQLFSSILAGKSQSRIQILDCYTDPLRQNPSKHTGVA